MHLRSYQQKLVDDLREKMRSGVRSVVAVAPTGAGKTVMASGMAKAILGHQKKLWFICHRDFLVTQTLETFQRNQLAPAVIAAGVRPDYGNPLQICMIDTLRNRLAKLEVPDVVMWDECHHLRAKTWEKVQRWSASALHIGWTATPERLDGKGLHPPFDDMVLGPSTGDLIELKMLSDYVAYAPNVLDMSEARITAGDYNQSDMQEAVEKNVIMGSVVTEYLHRARGKRAVYFCPSLRYSRHLADEFEEAGIRAMHLDGESPTDERIWAAKQFAAGKIMVLTNVALFGEGYDLAAQAQVDDVSIECVGLVRPTASLTLHRQQIGRGLRPKAEPAVLIDHVGNLERHGLPDEDIEWNLYGRRRQIDKKTTKECKAVYEDGSQCGAINKIHATHCCICHQPFPKDERPDLAQVDGRIEEVDKAAMLAEAAARKRKAAAEFYGCQTKEDFIRLGMQRGYHPRWAYIQWKLAKERVENQARSYLRDYNG